MFDLAVEVGSEVTVVFFAARSKYVVTLVRAYAPQTLATVPVLGFPAPSVAVAPPMFVDGPPMPTVSSAMLGGGQLVLVLDPSCGVWLMNSPSLSSESSSSV